MQRHAGGGNAVRAVACLPALVGAWRDPAGGALLSTSGTYPIDTHALEKPELIRGEPRTLNMSALGDALLDARDPPVRALFVYNSNPLAVAPDSSRVARGFAREDLFCVVHELFRTDTADWADIVLPATSQLEHFDIHHSYGHLYLQANQPSIAPLGEAVCNTELFRRLAARMGFTEPCLQESDDAMARTAFRRDDPRMTGFDFDDFLRRGFWRLAVPRPYAPFAEGNFPTPSGRCEFWSEREATAGRDPLPAFVPPRESAQSAPALAARHPLALISPPARNFLNSSFANLPSFVDEEGGPRLVIHPADAAPRRIAEGDEVRIGNDRGAFLARAEVSDRARVGVVVAPSVWWRKLAPGGENANAVTSQALTDLGGGATFYDCLVEVNRIDAAS
jgi:anaerobic selenocysteine-containing dehydrogenase